MIKHWFTFLVSCLICIASHAATCEEDLASKFEQTTQEYFASALVKDAKYMEKYFNFPLKLKGPYQEDKPTVISKKFFFKNYSLIFIKNKLAEHTDFYTDFSKLKSEAMSASETGHLKGFCDGRYISRPNVRFGPLTYEWFPKFGWKITEVSYSTDDKNNLFISVNNPDLEYTFP